MPYHFRTDKIVAYDDWTEWTAQGFDYRGFLRFWNKGPLPPDDPILPAVARAYVSEGRWVADCPAGCGSALLVTPTDRKYFCPDCKSGWYRIIWPNDFRRIETLLMQRPLVAGIPRTRNWRIGETVDHLIAENLEHGII